MLRVRDLSSRTEEVWGGQGGAGGSHHKNIAPRLLSCQAAAGQTVTTDMRRTHRLETSLSAWLCVSAVTGAEEDCLSEMLLTRTFSIPRFLPVTPSLIGWTSPACLVSLAPIGSNWAWEAKNMQQQPSAGLYFLEGYTWLIWGAGNSLYLSGWQADTIQLTVNNPHSTSILLHSLILLLEVFLCVGSCLLWQFSN